MFSGGECTLQEEREEPMDIINPQPSPGETTDSNTLSSRQQTRGQWANKSQCLFSMAGLIIGLGEVWRFPYLCFKNGGCVFFIPYIVCIVLCGFPMFFLEAALGQYTGEGGVTAWRKICPMFQGIGIASQVCVSYLNVYYVVVLAWTLMYLVNSFHSYLPWASCDNSWNTITCQSTSDLLTTTERGSFNDTDDFGDFMWSCCYDNKSYPEIEFFRFRLLRETHTGLGHINLDLAACLLIVWIICYFCIWKGIKSMGKVVYFTTTFPYLMLFILLIRGVTLPGALDGIKHYLKPDLWKLADIQVWADAGKQVIFSYGVCLGVVTALGSYNKYNNNCFNDCLGLCILNSGTSILAGFTIFSLLGFMAHVLTMTVEEVAASGPALAFLALPKALALLPGAQYWSVLFFSMIFCLGLDTQFICVQSLATAISDLFPAVWRKHGKQEILVAVISIVCFLLGLLFTTQGGMHLFTLFDLYGASVKSLFCIACLETIAITWIYGADRFCDNIEDMIGRPLSPVVKYCWAFITPLICVAILVLDVFSGFVTVVPWGRVVLALAFLFTLSSMICLPLGIFVALVKRSGDILSPSSDLRQVKPLKPRLTLFGCVIIDRQQPQTRPEEKRFTTSSV